MRQDSPGNILTIGGSFIKATVLNKEVEIIQEFNRMETPKHAAPENLLEIIKELVIGFYNYDADLQGLGIVSEKGLEMVITLGTGFRTVLLLDGHLLPHLELAHHPVSSDETYDDYVGNQALRDQGEKNWNKWMEHVLQILKTVFNYDRLYIGGATLRCLISKSMKT